MILGAGLVGMTAVAAQAAEPITGRWLTEDGKAIVTIGTCGDTVCGKVTTVLKPTPGAPMTDVYNPDPALRKRPIEGLPILSGFVAKGDSWSGKIYSPEEGKTYKSILKRSGPNALDVKGCILFFCKTQVWTRAR
jgi:uncharacterized protein (DUF2147 family)